MSQISPQLRATLSGFNGARRRKTKSPEEFYERWLEFKTKKVKIPGVKKVIDEAIDLAIEKTAEIMEKENPERIAEIVEFAVRKKAEEMLSEIEKFWSYDNEGTKAINIEESDWEELKRKFGE